ncbi:MAG: ImmA/IrrE family metallo-endopeptidase [Solobacterium sp.]|nr:ImmA/IrrE family metallo-endopeptidase [Solobacterium sp.]
MKPSIQLPNELIAEYSTRDPFQIAFLMDVTVKFINTKRQKGLCAIFDGYSFIFINQNLSEQMQRMTCAHELGHVLLHKDILTGNVPLLEYELFDIRNSTEYEANVFAANLLIDETELNEQIAEGGDVVSIASALDINVNLLLIKLIEMRRSGKELNVPFTPERGFLGRIDDREDSIG